MREAAGARGGARAGTTSAAVQQATLTLFAAKGYHGTALSEIASRVGISTPALYNHIDSKQALLTEIVHGTTRDVWSDFEAALERAGAGADVEARLREAVRTYALRHATHRREALIVNRDSGSVDPAVRPDVADLRRRHERAVRALVEEGMAEGSFQARPAPLISFAVLEMCVSIARWYDDDGELDAEEVAEHYSGYALRMARGGRDASASAPTSRRA